MDTVNGAATLTVFSDGIGVLAGWLVSCKALGIPYLYDPSQQIVRLEGADLREGVSGASVLIVNEYELEMLKKKTGLATGELTGLAGTSVVTLGERGSLILSGKKEVTIPAVTPERWIDPTGVGDAFRAGLIKGMSLKEPWEVCGRMGSLAAAYVLETAGPQQHRHTPVEFYGRYASVFGESESLKKGLGA